MNSFWLIEDEFIHCACSKRFYPHCTTLYILSVNGFSKPSIDLFTCYQSQSYEFQEKTSHQQCYPSQSYRSSKDPWPGVQMKQLPNVYPTEKTNKIQPSYRSRSCPPSQQRFNQTSACIFTRDYQSCHCSVRHQEVQYECYRCRFGLFTLDQENTC